MIEKNIIKIPFLIQLWKEEMDWEKNMILKIVTPYTKRRTGNRAEIIEKKKDLKKATSNIAVYVSE